MSSALSLHSGALEALVLPEIGGGLAEFNLRRAETRLPLLRPLALGRSTGERTPHPNQLACYPLIPWSNRIGKERFEFDGTDYRVARTEASEAYPLHGDGWKRSWRVVAHREDALTLAVDSEIAPFAYRGTLEYVLRPCALEVRLSVRNAGARRLPFGLGLHPWFVRTSDVRLRALARGIWEVSDDLLPVAHAPLPPDLDFVQARPLPDRLVDNSFTGWDGSAEITWLDTGVSLEITTAPVLAYFQLYAPPGRDVFCFEPISHPANAFNLPAPHAGAGLIALAPGQAAEIAVTFRVRADRA